MESLRVLSAVALAVSLTVTNLRAEDSQPHELRQSADTASSDYRSVASSQSTYEVVQPCLGRGYVPYSYPAIDSCHCARTGCFHPARYYCGGKQYRKQWFHKWVKAHLGRGSMLDSYPCHCVYPTAGRPYLRSVSVISASPRATLPPAPIPMTLVEE